VARTYVVPGLDLASGRRKLRHLADLRISVGQTIEPVSARSTMTPASSLSPPAWLRPAVTVEAAGLIYLVQVSA